MENAASEPVPVPPSFLIYSDLPFGLKMTDRIGGLLPTPTTGGTGKGLPATGVKAPLLEFTAKAEMEAGAFADMEAGAFVT
jgi:hypothetical protein